MPRKKPVIIDEEPEEEFEWDKPRIIGFFAVVILLIAGGLFTKHFVLDAQRSSGQAVQGVSTQSDISLPTVKSVQQGVSEQLVNLQQQASKISVQDIASSSPQVRDVLRQLQELPKQPGNIAKQTCLNICNSL